MKHGPNGWRAIVGCGLLALGCGCDTLEDLVHADVTVHWMRVDASTGALTALASPPGEPLFSMAPVALPNGEVAFIGVTDGEDLETDNMVLIYDPVSDAWRRGADWENVRTHLEWVTLGGLVCAADGFVQGPTLLHIFECYDVETDTWSSLATPTLWSSQLVEWDGKVYAFDGDRSNASQETSTKAAMFDPAVGAWSAIADKPACTSTEAVANDGTIFLFGCLDEQDGMATYDVATDTWTDPIRLSFSVTGGHVGHRETTTAAGKLYLADGSLREVDPADGSDRQLRPDGGTLATDTVTRAGASIVTIDREFAGVTVFLFDPLADAWTQGDTIPLPNLYADANVLNANGVVFLVASEVESLGVGAN